MTVQTEDQYFLVQLEKASLFSSLLYGTQTKLVSIQFADCQDKKKTHGLWPFPWKRSVWQNSDQTELSDIP